MAKNRIKASVKSHYASVDNNPVPDGKVGIHKPRRNYWGNLYDQDRFDEVETESMNYDISVH